MGRRSGSRKSGYKSPEKNVIEIEVVGGYKRKTWLIPLRPGNERNYGGTLHKTGEVVHRNMLRFFNLPVFQLWLVGSVFVRPFHWFGVSGLPMLYPMTC